MLAWRFSSGFHGNWFRLVPRAIADVRMPDRLTTRCDGSAGIGNELAISRAAWRLPDEKIRHCAGRFFALSRIVRGKDRQQCLRPPLPFRTAHMLRRSGCFSAEPYPLRSTNRHDRKVRRLGRKRRNTCVCVFAHGANGTAAVTHSMAVRN